MAYIFKDYQLNNGVLMKFKVNDNKHLLWREGGVPCLDAPLIDNYKDKINSIYIRTAKGRRFKAKMRDFWANKQEINFGFGRQYFMAKDKWDITEPSQEYNKLTSKKYGQ